jgi:ABC-type spermidine/putrescine transport system permease subunit II
LQTIHLVLYFVAGTCSALFMWLLKKRGAHVRFLVAHYQMLAGTFMAAVFLTSIFIQVICERRAPGTFYSIKHSHACLTLGYALVLPAVRLKWPSLLCVLALDAAAVAGASGSMGMSSADLQRTIAALGLGGLCALYLCSSRLQQSRVHFEVRR